MIYLKRLIFVILIATSCESTGQLNFEADIAHELKEVSAVELDLNSNILWIIEDAGNTPNLLGLNPKGQIVRLIRISNAKNRDWEDLTSDSTGNIYIGDFGNNNKKRKAFQIYKINRADLTKENAIAEVINFKLPKGEASKDFEAFFLFNNHFYIFSKSTKKFSVLKVPNTVGNHVAVLKSNYNLAGKTNRITSADISPDLKTVVLLNHDKIWKLTNYNSDNFLSGAIEKLPLKHNSQKEGVCFKTNNIIVITDERKGTEGGHCYSYKIN